MRLKKIKLPFKIKKPILALGPQTKNTICFASGYYAYLSPPHQDLSNPQDFSAFEKTAKFFLKKSPKIIAYDLHPEYQSTKYALGLYAKRYTLYAIQHHHAHIASCMLENGLGNQKIIGVAFDGTGLGSDNKLWGGEFFICDYINFRRVVHLKEIPLLGGEKAILEPLRIAVAWLYLAYKDRFLNLGLALIRKMDKQKWPVLKNMYLSGFNSPSVSSMGRLFDTVGSLVSGKDKINAEAELAIQLEKLATRYRLKATHYKFKIIKDKDGYIIDPLPMFKEIIRDLKAKKAKEKIAYCFHLTIAEMIRKACLILRRENKISSVVLSGGVFQNSLLLGLALDLLYKEGFQVFTHKDLSSSDSSISLGQIAVANFLS
ncbi:MAG: hypothetical protein V1884_00840 [Candidatus Omnitrophota bacterium]